MTTQKMKQVGSRILAFWVSAILVAGLIINTPAAVQAYVMPQAVQGQTAEVDARAAMEFEILTATLSGAYGMQGFEGDYAIRDANEIIEIVVQFRTPPAVALRLIEERGYSIARFSDSDFEGQALSAHHAFQQQLGQIPVPFSNNAPIEILSTHYLLFNGVFMRTTAGMAETISTLPEVFVVTPNYRHYFPSTELDEQDINIYFSQAYMPIEPHSGFWHNPSMMLDIRQYLNMSYIHNDLGLTGRNIRVGVIDSGIWSDHPEFIRFQDPVTGLVPGGHSWRNPATNQFSNDDEHGHGTSVAGILISIAPEVTLYAYRTDGEGIPGGTIVAGLESAHRDAMDVVNISMGSMPGNPFAVTSSAANLAMLDGIVVVIAAGNSAEFRVGYRRPYTLAAPAAAALPIAVGDARGVNTLNNMASHSSIGPTGQAWPDFGATGPISPAPHTHHIKPDISVFGMAVVAPRLPHPSTGDIYGGSQGTSNASPIIAGFAALLVQAFPDEEPWEIKARLMNATRPLRDAHPNRVFESGAGFSQFYEALRADTRVTVEHAVPVTWLGNINNQHNRFIWSRMSSLSFGGFYYRGDMDESMPLFIANNGNMPRTYTISMYFTNNPNDLASLSFSNSSITVAPGSEEQINVRKTVAPGAHHLPFLPGGSIETWCDDTLTWDHAYEGDVFAQFFEGYIYVRDGAAVVARLPFASVATDIIPIVSTLSPAEIRLRTAIDLALRGSGAQVVYLTEDVEITSQLVIPSTMNAPNNHIIFRSASEEAYTITATGNFDVFLTHGELTLDNVNVTRTPGTHGRGVDVHSADPSNPARLTILDGTTISGHHADTGGGGIQLRGHFATVVMEGGKIYNNTATGSGAGVHISGANSTFTMNDGEISNNRANGHGGGVFTEGNFIMTGGKIANNHTYNRGGGIGVSAPSLNDGRVSIGVDAVFYNNSASTNPVLRDSGDDDTYNQFIHGTQWTYPFTQGFNNWDIQIGTAGGTAVIEMLHFELRGTTANPTVPAYIDPIQVVVDMPLLEARSFPANPTRVGYAFDGWMLYLWGYEFELEGDDTMLMGGMTLRASWIVDTRSNDTALINLEVTGYTLTPLFDPEIFAYTVDVPYATGSVTVTAEANCPLADITQGLGAHSLDVGANSIIVTVEAENSNTQDYVITVTRAAPVILSNDATLNSLSITGYALSPAFSATTFAYIVNVPHATDSIIVTATANHPQADITAGVGTHALVVGSNVISIAVVAEDGTTQDYVVTVMRADLPVEPPTDPMLHHIVVAGGGYGAGASPNQASVGQQVSLNAGAPPQGFEFDVWFATSSPTAITVVNPTSATTAYFQMIDEPVTVTANWRLISPTPPTDMPTLPTDIPTLPTDMPTLPTDMPTPPTDMPTPPTDISPPPPIPTPTPDSSDDSNSSWSPLPPAIPSTPSPSQPATVQTPPPIYAPVLSPVPPSINHETILDQIETGGETITLTTTEDVDTVLLNADTLALLVDAQTPLRIANDIVWIELDTSLISALNENIGEDEHLAIRIYVPDYTHEYDGNIHFVVAEIDFAVGGVALQALNETYALFVNLSDFDLYGLNPHRITAVYDDRNIGGHLDSETSIFSIAVDNAGTFTIAYVENLRRITMQLESPVVLDLAENAPTQIMDVLPMVYNERTLLPVRFVGHALGADVDWIPANDYSPLTVLLTLDGQLLAFAIGEIAPGMDVPAMIVSDRTMVPLRFIGEFFGAVVLWDGDAQRIEIVK